MNKIQLQPKAKRLLREVQKQIRKAPTSFDMSVVVEEAIGRGSNREISASVVLSHELLPPCGTTACIAGHVLIKSNQPTCLAPLTVAADILGLSSDGYYPEGSEASRLFLSSKWPKYSVRDHQLIKKLWRLDSIRDRRISENQSTKQINKEIKAVIKERGQLAIKRIDLLINKGI